MDQIKEALDHRNRFVKLKAPQHNGFGDLIQDNNAQVILFGGEQDKTLAIKIAETVHTNIFNFAGKLSLMESACVMSHCDIMLSNDTGLLHMATALKIPVVAIFGSTTKELGFFPTGTPNRVLQVDLNCRPCTHIGRNTCPKGHFRCMQDITPLQVYNTLIQLYQQTSNQYVKGGESRI